MQSIRHTRRVSGSAGGSSGQKSIVGSAGGSVGQGRNGGGAQNLTDVDCEGNMGDADSRSTARGTKRPAAESIEQRGRRRRSRTALRNPPRGRKVVLIPWGDMQFKYQEFNRGSCKYTTQLGCILKRQYPGILKDLDKNEYPALTWSDYYEKRDDLGESCADKVKKEFWRLFTVADEHRGEASRIFENYARKRVRNMMYQVRVDSVKHHYEKKGEIIDDTLACRRILEEAEYRASRIDWCKEDVWPLLARYWVSDEYKEKRAKAQDSCTKSDDVAQNRGRSRPFAVCQQHLEVEFGPEKASILNTYAYMKSGAKNADSSGNSGPISSRKAQKRMDDYYEELVAVHPDTPDQQEFDGKVLYSIGHGLPHGRVPIGDGAVKKSDVLAAAKGRNIRPSNSESCRNLVQENEQLHRANEGLTRQNEALTQQQEVDHQLIMMHFSELGKEPPMDLLDKSIARALAHHMVQNLLMERGKAMAPMASALRTMAAALAWRTMGMKIQMVKLVRMIQSDFTDLS